MTDNKGINNIDEESLREMLRLSEIHHDHAIKLQDRIRVGSYSAIAFGGVFLQVLAALLASGSFKKEFITASAIFVMLSMYFAIKVAWFKRLIGGGKYDTDNDIKMIDNGDTLNIKQYLLRISRSTNNGTKRMLNDVFKRKDYLNYSIASLAIALIILFLPFTFDLLNGIGLLLKNLASKTN